MPFTSTVVHNVFILRWQGTEFADGATLVQRVKQAKNRCLGPLVYVAIVPDGNRQPDPATRLDLSRRLDELLELCSCVHLVLEGKGFRAATQRAIATGMFLMAGRHGRVSAHASLSEALSHCAHLSAPAEEILAKGRSLGALLEDTPRRAAGMR